MEDDYEDSLRSSFSVFCYKVFCYLLNNSGMSNSMVPVRECSLFTNEIGEAIMTISYIFQTEHRKTFYYLRKSLKTPGRLEEYCMLVPVNRDECYFFNFLKRISIIFDLAKNCLIHFNKITENYFETALICIDSYPDLLYFDEAGGWKDLQRSAAYLAKLGRPLKLLMKREFLDDPSIQTFSDAVDILRKGFLLKADMKMLDSQEMIFLDDLSKIFKANSKDVSRKKRYSPCPVDHSEEEEGNFKSEKEVLMDYFSKCFSEGIPERLRKEIPKLLKVKKSLLFNALSSFPFYTNILAFKGTAMLKNLQFQEFLEKEFQENAVGTEKRLESIQKKPDSTTKFHAHDVQNRCSSALQQDTTVDSQEKDQQEHSLTEDSGLLDELSNHENTNENMQDTTCETKHVENFKCKDTSVSPSIAECTETEKTVSDEPSKDLFNKLEEIEHISTNREKYTPCNFIVPEKYFSVNDGKYSDAFKYLYTANINASSPKKEKMTKSLKEILDKNIDSKSYRLMHSGDLFVSPPGSPPEEILFVFVDSSTDEDNDEDMDKLICLCKKRDLVFENKRDEVYKLRPRKPFIHRKDSSEIKASTSRSEATPKKNRNSKHRAGIDDVDRSAAYAKYLTTLYKKHFPLIFEIAERYKICSPLDEDISSDEAECASDPAVSGPSNVARETMVFVIHAGLLAKRKIELEDRGKCNHVLGLCQCPFILHNLEQLTNATQFNPGVLPPIEDKTLNYYIKKSKYSQIYSGVYIAGEFLNIAPIWYIFAIQRPNEDQEQYLRDVLRVAELYEQAVYDCDEFNSISRDFISSIVNAIRTNQEVTVHQEVQ